MAALVRRWAADGTISMSVAARFLALRAAAASRRRLRWERDGGPLRRSTDVPADQ
jgi:hypothetical protein